MDLVLFMYSIFTPMVTPKQKKSHTKQSEYNHLTIKVLSQRRTVKEIRFKPLLEKTDIDGKAPIYLFYNRNGEPL